MLGEIGVLVFVHKHVTKKLLIVAEHFGVVAHQHVGVVEQIVEVHGVGSVAAVAVGLVDFGCARSTGPAVRFCQLAVERVCFRRYECVFCSGDVAGYGRGFVYFFIKIHGTDDAAYEGARVGGVVDGVAAFEAEQPGVVAE